MADKNDKQAAENQRLRDAFEREWREANMGDDSSRHTGESGDQILWALRDAIAGTDNA